MKNIIEYRLTTYAVLVSVLLDNALPGGHVAQHQWDEAIELLGGFLKTSFIDRVLLMDTAGTLRADVPAHPQQLDPTTQRIPGIREFRTDGSPSWAMFIGGRHLPRILVVPFAIPIRSEGLSIGIILLQIRMDKLITWKK